MDQGMIKLLTLLEYALVVEKKKLEARSRVKQVF